MLRMLRIMGKLFDIFQVVSKLLLTGGQWGYTFTSHSGLELVYAAKKCGIYPWVYMVLYVLYSILDTGYNYQLM